MEELSHKIKDKEIQLASIIEKQRVITINLNNELKELKREFYSSCKHKCSGLFDTHDNEICQDEHCECPWHLLPDGTRINLDEVLNDISKVVGSDVRDKLRHPSWGGLLYGFPKHSNLYYVIVHIYSNTVPLWFAKKYTDIEPNHWSEHIQK